jgi:hypothetical protein
MISTEDIFSLLFLIALIAAVVYSIRRRIQAHGTETPKEKKVSEREIEQRIRRMSPQQQRELEIHRMRYKSSAMWHLIDPKLQAALLNQIAPRWIARNGRAVTEAQAEAFLESLRSHPTTAKIEDRLNRRASRPLRKK